MIISNLTGGLGNQMFQYALGRHLAIKHKTDLKLHFSNALFCTPRYFSLDCFNIKAKIATDKDIKRFGYPTNKTGKVIMRLFRELHLSIKPKIIVEKQIYKFDQSILSLPDNVYVEGYWQNEKYFKDIESIIRQDFSFKYPMDKKNNDIVNQIKKTNSVSIHIRRGDYVTHKTTNLFLGLLDLEYYQKAMKKIESQISNPCYFVFSDDIGWAKTNLKSKFPIYYIDNNKETKSYEDMRLMSLCKHNIIANSSFSWWGAWLNINPDKLVIAPKIWSRRHSIDIISTKWIKV